MENLDTANKYKFILLIDNFYIKGFLFFDQDILLEKKIPILQEFFNPLFNRVSYLNKIVSFFIHKYNEFTDINSIEIDLYTSLDFFRKDFLEITSTIFVLNQDYFNNISSEFSKKFDNIPTFILNISRDSIFISGNSNFSSQITSFDYLYDQLFKIKDFSDLSILNGKIRKYNLYNFISRFSLNFKEEMTLPILSLLNKNLLSNFNYDRVDSIPIFILTGDLYQFLSNSNYAVFSLLYGLHLEGIISVYIDNNNVMSLLNHLPDEYIFSNIKHVSDVFNVGFSTNAPMNLDIDVKIVDDESIKNIKVNRNNIITIPVKDKAHITINLPERSFIGEKKDMIEMISKSNIMIDTRDRSSITPFSVAEWIENSQNLIF